jgi:quercetin dioxygenase-like cupin family protein
MKSHSLLLLLFASILFLTPAAGEEQSERAVMFADTEDIPWQPVQGVAGARWKPLRTDPVSRAVTAVVQFPAGAVEDPHHHTHGHMIYILSGAKVVENLSAKKDFTLSEGMYLYTPAGNVHRIRYLTRCTFLFVTDGPFDMIWSKK